MLRRSILPTALFAVLLGAAPAPAQIPRDVADLVGARAAGAETQMQARGYRMIRSTRTDDTVWSFWWSQVQQQCVSVALSDGRYQALNVASFFTCLYFSASIITTTGLGEFVPRPEARFIAAVQMIFGYLAFGIVTAAVFFLLVDRSRKDAPS